MDADRAVAAAQADPYLAAAAELGGTTAGGADDPYLKAAAEFGGRAAGAPAGPPERDFGGKLLHQGGLALQQGYQGTVGTVGSIFIDPFVRLARDIYEEARPKTLTDLVAPRPKFPTTSEATKRLFDRYGVKEETPAEEAAGSVTRAIAGAGTMLGLTRLIAAAPEVVMQLFSRGATPEAIDAAAPQLLQQLPKFSPGATQVPQVAPTNLLTQQPALQAGQAAIGASAAEGVKQAGGGEGLQMAASMIAPLGATTATNVVTAGARGLNELRRPFTLTGAKQIAADVVGQLPVDKQGALGKLDAYIAALERDPNAVGVPGSKPTAGAVAQDYGLIGGEQLASREGAAADFSKRFADNNAARLDMLSRLKATREQLANFEARRDTITAPLREQAFTGATGPVDFDPVVVKILNEAAKPSGGRSETEKALTWVTKRVGRYLDEGRISADHAYELYKDIGDLVKGKIKDENGAALKLAGGVANSIKQELGLQIEKVAPGFRNYLDTYSRLSGPIDRLEVLTERLGGRNLDAVVNSLPMAGERGVQQQLSQHKMRGAVQDIEGDLASGDYRGSQLAPRQQNTLTRVMEDLTNQELAQRGGKRPGSDTYQNMATANLLNAIFGKTLAESGAMKGAVERPISFIAKPLEARIRDMIDKAYLDPKLMAELLRMSRTTRDVSLRDLTNATNRNIYGGVIGGAAAQ